MADLGLIGIFWERLLALVSAPSSNQEMLWVAIPLAVVILLMALYAGKYREELGWSSAFQNTTVYLFVAIDIIRKMFNSTAVPSWSNIYSNTVYLTISLALIIAGFVFMLVTFYHLLPKKWAFFAFDYTSVNISLYVIMTIVYTNVPADLLTALAGLMLFAVIYTFLNAIKWLEAHAGREEGIEIIPEKKPGDLAEKFKREAERIRKKKEAGELKPA